MQWIQKIQTFGKSYKIILPREFVRLNCLESERYVLVTVKADGSAVMEKIKLERKRDENETANEN
jgi:hypothetical protein